VTLAEDELARLLMAQMDPATRRTTFAVGPDRSKIVAKAAGAKKLENSADFKKRLAFAAGRSLRTACCHRRQVCHTMGRQTKVYEEASSRSRRAGGSRPHIW